MLKSELLRLQSLLKGGRNISKVKAMELVELALKCEECGCFCVEIEERKDEEEISIEELEEELETPEYEV